MTTPASIPTNGTTSAWFVEALADPGEPTVAEMTDPTTVELSCYLTGDGLNPDTAENTIEDPRLCERQTFEQPGDYTRSLELTYVFNPKSAPDNEAQLALAQGTTGFVVVRWADDSDEAPAAADIVDVYPITAGAQRKQQPTRNTVHKIMQKLFVTGAMRENVVIVA